ncbi:uncharacterized protein SOCE836_035350 [Sorangium cellulosum]|uniref:Uncharacterized protein n=1 Tax=Sorangium cellulosum TaxID=56 RepID=A0A4P2QNB1_SORCE|nr:uncharacterized protein SOCE836_035350 [Sorangium cellulosum]
MGWLEVVLARLLDLAGEDTAPGSSHGCEKLPRIRRRTAMAPRPPRGEGRTIPASPPPI